MLREGVPNNHLEGSLVYMYFPSFSLENKLFGIHQTSFLPVEAQGLRFRGPGRRSLGARSQKEAKKSRKKSPGAGAQKSEKSLEKGPKSLRKPIFRLLFDFSDLLRDFFRTFGPRPRETFFETFWLRAPRLLLPSPRNLNTRCFQS